MESKKWLQDYQQFLQSNTSLPADLNTQTLSKMEKLLNPSSLLIFSKVLFINAAIGFLSLSICHQFGLNPFNTTFTLESIFMQIGGHSLCGFLCGFFFVSGGFLLSSLLLTIEEFRALNNKKFVHTFAVSITLLTFLIIVGAEVAVTMGLLWLVGAFLASLLSIQGLFKFRTRRYA